MVCVPSRCLCLVVSAWLVSVPPIKDTQHTRATVLPRTSTIQRSQASVIILPSETIIGHDIHIALLLPIATQESQKWALYSGSTLRRIGEGELLSTPQLFSVKVRTRRLGRQALLLSLLDGNGKPAQVFKAEYEVCSPWWVAWAEKSSGIVLGALVAIVVFVIQACITRKRNAMRRRAFSATQMACPRSMVHPL